MPRRPFGHTGLEVHVRGRGLLRTEFDCIADDAERQALALRFAAYAPGVDCVIVGAAWQGQI